MKKCQECGTFSPDETVFCSTCGKKISDILGALSNDFRTEYNDIGSTLATSENSAPTHPEIMALLQRIILFLEDGEFSRADDYCERILDIEPTNAEVYMDKLLIEFKCNTREQLQNCSSSIANSKNYVKIIRFGNEEQKAFLADVERTIQIHLESLSKQSEQEKAEEAEQQAEEPLTETEQREFDFSDTDEDYIDIYCPYCHEELSYINWQIAEGELICPMCNAQFEFDERMKR